MIVREILVVFCVCLVGCFAQPTMFTSDGTAVDSGTNSGKEMDTCGSCEAHCSLTYPEHTYPRPLDSSACRRGCRLAQIESLIAWPFSPQKETCTNTCKEAYSSSSTSEQYACLVGCNATTITSLFADTRTITGEQGMVDSLQGMLHLMVMSGTDQDSSSLDSLTQQAEILLPVSSSVSIVSKNDDGEEIISFTSYRIGGGDAPPFKLAFESNDDISSSNDDADMEDFVGNTGTGSSHFFQCFWRRQPLFGRLMMVFFLGFIIFAILTCCFAICGNSTEEEKKSHLKEESSKPRSLKQVVMAGDVKVPLELTSEFTPYRLPVVLQGDKRVEGILTVI